MTHSTVDLCILYEHPEWQKPLFKTLDQRDINYLPFDLKKAAFDDTVYFDELPHAKLYFNQASPSAYVRGNTRSVPFNLALMEYLEISGQRVINGLKAFRFELSKMTQIAVMQQLGISYPKTIAFNDINALKRRNSLSFPAILKPNQGGSGARMYKVDSINEIEFLLEHNPNLWLPDNLLLLQEYIEYDSDTGIIRLEYLGNELLYAMRIVSKDKNFNLCPSDYCNPLIKQHSSINEINFDQSEKSKSSPVHFFPYPEVPAKAVEIGQKLIKAGGLDIGAVEYIETSDGSRIFYDINANSNLRLSIGEYFGFNPFERVADFLETQLQNANSSTELTQVFY